MWGRAGKLTPFFQVLCLATCILCLRLLRSARNDRLMFGIAADHKQHHVNEKLHGPLPGMFHATCLCEGAFDRSNLFSENGTLPPIRFTSREADHFFPSLDT